MSNTKTRPDTSKQFADRDSAPIAWREAGMGEAVVFLHGMPGSRTSWNAQMGALASDCRCIAWDMPGYGASRPIDPGSDFPVIAETLQTFITGPLGVEKAHLVGLSLGGMIAMHAAAAGHGYIRSITILDASPCFGLDGGSDPAEFVADVVQGLKDASSINEFARAIVPDLVAPDCPPSVLDDGISSMSRASAQGLELAARLIARHDIRSQLGAIDVPALIMAGALDQATPPSYADYIGQHIPGAKCVIVPQAGHLSNIENPAFVNMTIREFLTAM